MDNLKSPASPTNLYNSVGGANGYAHGFTKLEMAALMIAQGLASDPANNLTDALAKLSVSFAKVVLEEANK